MAGTYSVTLTGSVSITALDLGGTSGQQMLTVQGDATGGRAELDLADATTSVVDSAGVLDVGGGQSATLAAPNASSAVLDVSGVLETNGSVTVEIPAHVLAGGNFDVLAGWVPVPLAAWRGPFWVAGTG